MTFQQHLILALIPKGRRYAITAQEIAQLTEMDTRTVRKIISQLRRDGEPIASAVHHPAGFYVPATKEEANETLRHLYSRIEQLGKTANALKKAING